MKHFYLLSFFLLSISASSQVITFTDTALKNKLLSASPGDITAKDVNGNYVAIDTNADNEIEIAEALVIFELDLKSSNISDLTGLEHFINLTRLEINLNTISSFDGTTFTNLEYLDFSNNNLTTTNLTGLVNLQIFWAFGNPFTSIDVSTLSSLNHFNIDYCDNLTSLDVSNLTNLEDLSCSSNDNLTSLTLTGCTALEDLNCQYGALTSLDLSGLSSLSSMFAENNNIATIDVTGATSLGNLNIAYNQISTLVVHDLPFLQSISASGNQISTLDILNCPFLFTLVIDENELTTLDLYQSPNITIVIANNNLLDTLILAPENEIVQINLAHNFLEEINLNECYNLNWGTFNDNPNLAAILMKNGSLESLFNTNINNLPNLQYVCADFEQLTEVHAWLGNNGYTTYHVNDYCTFVPGGKVYEIQGQTYFDFDNNGCSETDPIVPFLQYTVFNGSYTGTGIANDTGYYYIPVQLGTHTITPVIPNASLYDVTPSQFSVSFPGSVDPYEQDFCFTPSGEVNDLQVILTPLTPARPGFDADYELVVNNVGNQILSGDVNLVYPENLVSYLSSDIPFDASDTNSFSWNFNDLEPFQSFVVNIVFNVNPPTHPDFPVNIDDILTYTATVNPIAGDANPEDNVFVLNQTVVGSFDPNDILCLEGESILTNEVGDYVHYRIRFENTGTFPAENIVIKNPIDPQKLDISSLRVINGSHEFVTRIIEDDIEFVFENIQLPFDDENNDGYVLYKIKTLPNLVEGDLFTNNAEIYFDFNFPIQTNDYSTEVTENLSINEVTLFDNLIIYPNPAENRLNINTPQHQIENIRILNVLGQLVKELSPNDSNVEIDISKLRNGIYFIEIHSSSKQSTKKFIKR